MVRAIGGEETLGKEQLNQQKETVSQLKDVNTGVDKLVKAVENNSGGFGP